MRWPTATIRPITRIMAEIIVDLLEPVEIEIEQCETAPLRAVHAISTLPRAGP
jgi:hypothetical protein